MELALGKHIELLLGDAWRATADVLPETLQHRFSCEQYLRRLPNRIKDADPDFPIPKQAKAEYAKLQ